MTGIGRRALRTVATDARSEDGSRRSRTTSGRGSPERARAGHGGRAPPGPRLRARSIRCRIWRGSAVRRSCGFTSTRRGAARPSCPRALRGHLAGIDAADSITCDAHKWFSVPMGAGMFFCRHPDARWRGVPRADLPTCRDRRDGPVVDPYTTSVQWSRRFIGLKLFLALAQHGESGYVAMIEHQARMGDVLRESLAARGMARRQQHAAAARLLHARRPRRQQIPRRLCTSVRSRGCRKSASATTRRSCARVSRVSGPAESDIEWVVREMSRLVCA